MRLLEQELGVTLFTRTHRGMQLTEAGEALRLHIAGPLRQIGHALYEIRSLPPETGGTVILGMPPTTIPILAEPLFSRVKVKAPKIVLRIIEAQSGHLLEWMKRGDLDSAILYGPTPAGLNATRLLDDELVLVGPANFWLKDQPAVEFKLLTEQPLVLPSDAHGLRIAIENVAAKTRTKLNIVAQIDSLQLRKRLVEHGAGVTILPAASFVDEAAAGRLTFEPLDKPRLNRQQFIAKQTAAEAPRAVLQVEQFVRQEVMRLVREGAWPRARLLGIGDS
jgi:DNA-binding transcriptional LysR family regulator